MSNNLSAYRNDVGNITQKVRSLLSILLEFYISGQVEDTINSTRKN